MNKRQLVQNFCRALGAMNVGVPRGSSSKFCLLPSCTDGHFVRQSYNNITMQTNSNFEYATSIALKVTLHAELTAEEAVCAECALELSLAQTVKRPMLVVRRHRRVPGF